MDDPNREMIRGAWELYDATILSAGNHSQETLQEARRAFYAGMSAVAQCTRVSRYPASDELMNAIEAELMEG